jgi:beta-galactosidase
MSLPCLRHAILAGILLGIFTSTAQAAEPAHTFAVGDDAFLLDGKPYVIRCGEVHAARVPKEYWRHRLQMAKAMGLNTVCAYLFWNQHEPTPGNFTWDDRADIAEYCRIAQELGLWVILRPGPYACAEWEMGGLPWWLLKHDDIALRSRDPRFIEATRRYFKEVGRELAPLQITQGGPIIMVQAENEYGFYGTDAEYMGEIRQALLDAGFDVPLFACNPKDALRKGYRDDLFPVVNFGSDPAGAFAELRKILPKGPLMCGEFYPGWFDTWGAPHHTGNTDRYLADLEYMLKNKASFSIYMAHGGTSFGFGTGADRPFKPDTSSYDYDAPISEAGWPTDKFWKTRELFAKYLNPGAPGEESGDQRSACPHFTHGDYVGAGGKSKEYTPAQLRGLRPSLRLHSLPRENTRWSCSGTHCRRRPRLGLCLRERVLRRCYGSALAQVSNGYRPVLILGRGHDRHHCRGDGTR